MSRHRNIRRPNYDDEYDDVYGSSYGASYDEHEMCVSPGTVAQFTFERKSSDDEQSRRRLDSINENDRDPRDYDVDIDMEGLDIDQDVEIPIEEERKSSEYTSKNPQSMSEALDLANQKRDFQEASHSLRPLLIQKKQSLVKRKQPTSRLACVFRSRGRDSSNWFIPVNLFMKNYNSSHAYWFSFDSPSQQFPLGSKVKGYFDFFASELTLTSFYFQINFRHL